MMVCNENSNHHMKNDMAMTVYINRTIRSAENYLPYKLREAYSSLYLDNGKSIKF